MSYDLYLKPASNEFTDSDFKNYFSQRHNYQFDGSQAWYGNEETGVYFLFELQDSSNLEDGEEFYPVMFNMNYFRPFCFIKEAEQELTRFAQHFNMQVSDPQVGGMGQGAYYADKFVQGWIYGNEFGYKSILSNKDNGDVYSLPGEKLSQIWQWNYNRNTLQNSLADDVFVPLIMFFSYQGQLVTGVAWPDGIPILMPEVDMLIISRQTYAPRKFLRKAEDMVVAHWDDFYSLIDQHKQKMSENAYYLFYESVPKPIAEKIKSLSAPLGDMARIPADQVLDAEIVARYTQ